MRLKAIWKDYGLSLVLAVLFLVSWVGQTLAGWQEFKAEQQALHQVPTLFGSDGYFWSWLRATMENWQSEFLQLLTFVVLTSFLIHKGSHESKDTDEEFEAAFARIEQSLARLEARSDGQSGKANRQA